MKKITMLLLILFTYIIGYGQQPVPSTQEHHDFDPNLILENRAEECGDIPDFVTNSFLTGPNSQDFEEEFDEFDTQAADDFMITADGTICQIEISGEFFAGSAGFTADPDGMVIMEIWDDAGGLPGTMIYSESFNGASVTDSNNIGIFTLVPTGGPELVAGTTYWLSIVAQLSFTLGGQWGWNVSDDGFGNFWAWQNPGDGFGFGCTTWSDGMTCNNFVGSDLAMDISFQSTVLSTDENVFDGFSFFPNPVQNTINISTQTEVQKITLFNLVGQAILEQEVNATSSQIDISRLTSGVYLMQISVDGQIGTYKVIKE